MAKDADKNKKKTGKGEEGTTGGESSLRTLVNELRKENNSNGELIISTNFILTNISNNIADIAAKIVDGGNKTEVEPNADITEHMVVMNFILTNISKNIADLADHIISLPISTGVVQDPSAKSGVSSKEKEAELQKQIADENKDRDEQSKKVDEQTKILKDIHKSMQKGGVLDLILGGAMALAGFISGFVGEYIRLFKKILSPLSKLFGEGKGLSSLIESFKTGWAKFGGYLDDIIKGVLENKYIAKVVGVFKSGWNSFVGYFKGIADLFKSVADMWVNLFGSGGGGGFFKNIMTWFQAIGERLGWFFKLGSALGKILGKIAIPIQIIMSIFDTVSGALDGWNKTEGSTVDKIFGAIKGGITGLLNGLVGGLLDLLKDGVSWLLNLMGFEELSKSLDSFSFQEVIGSAVDGFFNFIKGMVNFVMDIFTNPEKAMEKLAAIGDMAKEGLKKILRALLPNPSAGGMSKVAAGLIPDAVYEFAGMDPKTGAVVAQTSETGVATKALENTTTENTAVKAEKEAKAATAAAAASMSNNSSQTVNTSTTQAAIIRSKATNWDPEDQFARGMAWGA